MPQYSKGDENKYFPAVIASLVVVGFGLSSIIYAFLKTTPAEIEDDIILNPSSFSTFPTSAPNLNPPTHSPEDTNDESYVCDSDCDIPVDNTPL